MVKGDLTLILGSRQFPKGSPSHRLSLHYLKLNLKHPKIQKISQTYTHFYIVSLFPHKFCANKAPEMSSNPAYFILPNDRPNLTL